MTPRMTIIAAAIRKLIQGGSTEVDTGDVHWDNVVLAMRMDSPPSADPHWDKVVVAMHLDNLIDLKGHTVIVNSGSISTTEKKFGTGSFYTTAASGLKINHSSDLDFGSSDFTVEFWWYKGGTVAAGNVFSKTTTGGAADFQMYFDGTNIQLFIEGMTNSHLASTVSAGWHHLAVSRVGTSVKGFYDGTNTVSGTLSGPVVSNTEQIVLGNSTGGYIDDLRITIGVGRYTTSFSVPTSAFPGEAPPFIDEKGHAVTVKGLPFIQSLVKKFGTGSAYFDGSGDYLTIQADASLALGSGDFTIESWVYPLDSTFNYYLFGSGVDGYGTAGWYWLSISNTGFNFNGYSVTPLTGSATISGNAWHHIAVSRYNGTLRIFVDGVSVGSVAHSSSLGIGTHFTIGAGNSSGGFSPHWKGYIDDFRITKGVARYTANFTPSTQPISVTLPYDKWWDNVSLLMRMDTLTDEKGHSIAVGGGASVQTVVKKTGTGATYFDGVDDYLSVPSSADFGFGTGDFTIEAWVYILADSPQNSGNSLRDAYICSSYTDTNVPGTFGFYVAGNASKTGIGLGLSVYDGAYKSCTATVTVTKGVWHHVAVTRASGAVMLFLDGIKQTVTDTVLTANLVTQTTNPIWIGAANNSGYPSKLNGYIDDLRITKGVARYTSSFTPTDIPVRVVDTLASQVVSLIRFDGVSGGTTITDEKGVVWTKASSDITTETDIKKYGPSAGKFINTVQYSTGPVVNIGNNQSYCIECWAYLTSGGEYQGIFDIGSTLYVYVNTLNILVYQVQGGYAMSTALDLHRWYHIAIIRTGTSVQFTLDGVVIGTATSTTQYINAVMTLGYNVSVTRGNKGLMGRMDNFRLTVGSPRYTTTPFVPADCEYLT